MAAALMTPETEKMYHAVLTIIEELMGLDPEPQSVEGRMLLSLVALVEDFEKAEFPEFNRPPP